MQENDNIPSGKMDNEKEEESKVDSNKSEEIENDGVNLKHNEVKQDTKIPPVL